jgi:hypothetical protein
LKKRTKKLLSPAVRASHNARARVQKFFASFFKKEVLPSCLTQEARKRHQCMKCGASPVTPMTIR